VFNQLLYIMQYSALPLAWSVHQLGNFKDFRRMIKLLLLSHISNNVNRNAVFNIGLKL